MSFGAAILAAGAIGAGASIYGSNQSAKAAKKAAAAQTKIYEANKALAQPYIDQGQASYKLYLDATGANGPEAQAAYFASRQTDPAYQDANDFAMEGINRSAAARGDSLGGNTLAALYDYGQKNRFAFNQGQIDNYFRGGQIGLNALSSLMGAGQGYASGIGNAFGNLGNAQAGGAYGVGSAANQTIGNYLDYMTQNQRYAQGAAGGGAGGFITSVVPTSSLRVGGV